MKLYKECEYCKDKLYLKYNTFINFYCQKCGHIDGVLRRTDEIGSEYALECFCNTRIYIKTGTHNVFAHNCEDGKRSNIFRIISPESMKEENKEEREGEIHEMVSTIIVCHNNLDMTKKCVQHVRKSLIPTQIILVDNNSIDDTEDWTSQPAQKDILYIKNRVNFGCAVARNQGAKWATGRYVLFLDNDQFISPKTISELLKLNSDIAGSELWIIKNDQGDTIVDKDRSKVEEKNYIGAGGMLAKKSVFDSLGGFDERYAPAWYEDVDFSFRAKTSRYSLKVTPTNTIRHIGGSTSNFQKDYNFKKSKDESRALFLSIWKDYIINKVHKSRKPALRSSIHKPRIMMVVDSRGWAWDYKTEQIVRYLSNEFNFSTYYWCDEKKKEFPRDFDIYFTYDCNFVKRINISPSKIISGVTAHTYTNFINYKEDLKNVIAVHANSILLYNEIKEINGNCFYVPNGVDENHFKYTKRDITRPFMAAYVGKPNRRKGLNDFIIPACQRAGVYLKQQACKVHSPERICRTQMPEFYKDIDLVIVASDMDGTPNQLLEAASCGRTFIGNKIGNIPEFCEDGVNGFSVDRDVSAYVEKLLFLKKNRKKCREMGDEARKTVEKDWTWRKQAENYRYMFKKVLSI